MMTGKRDLTAQKGLYFEEYEVGQSITSQGRTVTEADVVAFAALSGDWNPMHTDAEFASKHPFGQRVAHGLLVLSIGVGLAVRLGFLEETALAFREIGDWKFSLPVYFGDTIRVKATVTDTKPMPRLRGGLVTLNVQILNQDDKVVQRGTLGVLIRGREG
jgi:3-hydroxybutyryl-CoA dehydratase